MNFDEKLNNVSSSINETKEDAATNKASIGNENQKEQLVKCNDASLLDDNKLEEPNIPTDLDPLSESNDVLLQTGEYYHDHENYPSHITFKHPFMNIISLLCGLLSSLFCVCAAPAPFFHYLPALWLILSAIFSVLGIGLFIFDLIKSKTVNGLSISGLIVSLLGAILSAIMAVMIVIAFIINIILTLFGQALLNILGTTTIGGIIAALIAFL
jgi:hypothetical protein